MVKIYILNIAPSIKLCHPGSQRHHGPMGAQLTFSGYFSCCSLNTVLEQQRKGALFSQGNQCQKYSVSNVQNIFFCPNFTLIFAGYLLKECLGRISLNYVRTKQKD